MDEERVIEFLKSNGYKIIKLKDGLKNYKELTKYFISRASSVYKQDISYDEYTYAKTFVKQMSMNGNENDRLAISQCVYVIDTVFENFDWFPGFKFNSLKVFTINKNAWIVEKCYKKDKPMLRNNTGYTENEWIELEAEYQEAMKEDVDIKQIKQDLLNILES